MNRDSRFFFVFAVRGRRRREDRFREKSRPQRCVRRPGPIVRLGRSSSAPSSLGLMVSTMGLKNA